ncbi:MAG: class I SAM-dependent methyltransferase [Actinobacteria bacterium]|nr:class I SAM-dependent methyltransferase [Actinomycetota bacterium]MBW3641615.1 class I SAM-dependent methyltransferase [Actinomycetota bacterium]
MHQPRQGGNTEVRRRLEPGTEPAGASPARPLTSSIAPKGPASYPVVAAPARRQGGVERRSEQRRPPLVPPAYAAVVADFDPSVYGASGIADEYDVLYADHWETEAAVERLVELAEGGPVLELGIGTGRLALPLLERGIEVHGVDGSEEMVSKLRQKPGGERIPVVVGDFAKADAGREFPLVVLAVNTIFALPDQQAQVECFRNAARHLVPSGRFVVEAWVPDIGGFRHNRLVRPRITRPDTISIETAELDPVEQIMRTTQAVFSNGSVRLYPANHRYAWPAELDLMAQVAGLHREERWADWRRSPFTADSEAHVSVYRR